MTQAVEDTDVSDFWRQKNKIILSRLWKTQWFLFLSYDLQWIFIHNQQKRNRGNTEDAYRNLQRLSQFHPGVFWRCPLIKAIIVGIMIKRSLWGQKVALLPPPPHTSPSSHNCSHIKGPGHSEKWAMSVEKRAPRQEQRVEHINPAHSSCSLFPWKLQSHGCLTRCDRTTVCLPSRRISQVVHPACLGEETYFTPSHTDNVTGTTESLSIDLSVHQSASYLHCNAPVNKSCKPSLIFIPRKWKVKLKDVW